MPTCTRRLTFEAGHRVMGHENLCAHTHGHSWKVWVTAQGASLDSVGRVIDFGVLKQKVGGWIDAHWDHAFIVHAEDTVVIDAFEEIHLSMEGPPRLFALPTNPTSEHLAHYLLHTVCPLVLRDTGVTVVKVVIQETENCTAEAGL
jgi:6-pyruvoyltetrahydropterin/6-carboxytetrahydropterin synthase